MCVAFFIFLICKFIACTVFLLRKKYPLYSLHKVLTFSSYQTSFTFFISRFCFLSKPGGSQFVSTWSRSGLSILTFLKVNLDSLKSRSWRSRFSRQFETWHLDKSWESLCPKVSTSLNFQNILIKTLDLDTSKSLYQHV